VAGIRLNADILTHAAQDALDGPRTAYERLERFRAASGQAEA
jgi:hypothetical protein